MELTNSKSPWLLIPLNSLMGYSSSKKGGWEGMSKEEEFERGFNSLMGYSSSKNPTRDLQLYRTES